MHRLLTSLAVEADMAVPRNGAEAIRVGGEVVGILCHEHVGGPHRWLQLSMPG